MGMTIEEWKLNERKDEYLKIGDIVERFNHIDGVYGHAPWTLEQIYSNLNMLVGKEIEEDSIYVMGYNRGFKNGIKGSITKDQYEARLKADKVAMLTELQSEIEMMSDSVVEHRTVTIRSWNGMQKRIWDLVQSKIDKLKEIEVDA